MVYDMILEVLGVNFNELMWWEKYYVIGYVFFYIFILESIVCDLVKFFLDIILDDVIVVYCGVVFIFILVIIVEISVFKYKYGISKFYFFLVGVGSNYKNVILFFWVFV